MQPNTQNPQTTAKPVKKPSTKPSITGGVLSVLALIVAAIGSALVNSKYKSPEPVTTAAEKAGEAVASGTWRVLTTIFSIPLIVAAVGLALLAIVLTVIRLGKVKAAGWILSILWIVLSIWAIKIAYAALMVVKASPS